MTNSPQSVALKDNNLLIVEDSLQRSRPFDISIRCPHCRQNGTFAIVLDLNPISYSKAVFGSLSARIEVRAGLFLCPNSQCKGLVFNVSSRAESRSFPPERIDFDPNGIPDTMLMTLQEAIACHAAGSNRAAAMMVRRLLEEICEENQAQGRDLHQRLEALKDKITLPQELFSAMFELKALGNDAAHIEAKAYNTIGADEAADSIELAKEILKALYQLKSLVTRLQSRRRQ